MAKRAKSTLRKIVDYLLLSLLGLVLFTLSLNAALIGFRAFFYEPYRIPSGSMMPTLLVGDRMWAAKWAYRGDSGDTKPIARGQVFVYRAPKDPGIIYVMRVIGIGGDKIKIEGFHVTVNGKELNRREHPHFGQPEMDKFFDDYLVYEETSDGNTYSVMWKKGKENAGGGTFDVPAGQLFFLGDNRSESYDSRSFGTVDASAVQGRPVILFFSTSEQGPRMWRVGQKIR